MDGQQVSYLTAARLLRGGSRRRVVAGFLGVVGAAQAVSGKTAVAKRPSRRRRDERCGDRDGTRLIVSGVAAGGEPIALLLGKPSSRWRHAVRFAWDGSSATLIARGTVLLPDGQTFDFAGPVDLTRSAGSCERLLLHIGPLDITAPDAPVQIALLLPAIQAAREAARRRLCEIGRLLEQDEPAPGLVGGLNAMVSSLGCAMDHP